MSHIRGQGDRNDLSGPDDVAQPGVHRRLAAGRSVLTHTTCQEAAGTGPSDLLNIVGIPRPGPGQELPHAVLWPA